MAYCQMPKTPGQSLANKCPMMGTDSLLNAPPMLGGMGGLEIDRALCACLYLALL